MAQPTCFVAIPYDARNREYLDEIYRPAIEQAGARAVMAKEIFATGAFMRQVVDGIVSSAVVLADLTGRNANVFYEVGLAHAYRKPVIMLTQRRDDVPADLQGLRWIEYETAAVRWADTLRAALVDAVEACLAASSIERARDFLPAAVQVSGVVEDVARRVAELSPMQRRIFDWIRQAPAPVRQIDLERQFAQQSRSEVFYRAEVLRLQGLVTSQLDGRSAEGRPLYAYRLSDEVAFLG